MAHKEYTVRELEERRRIRDEKREIEKRGSELGKRGKDEKGRVVFGTPNNPKAERGVYVYNKQIRQNVWRPFHFDNEGRRMVSAGKRKY